MTSEMIKGYLNKECKISMGSFGSTVAGRIIKVEDNWIEVETKKEVELVNADFIQSIKIKR